jgi:hypothetical protein
MRGSTYARDFGCLGDLAPYTAYLGEAVERLYPGLIYQDAAGVGLGPVAKQGMVQPDHE